MLDNLIGPECYLCPTCGALLIDVSIFPITTHVQLQCVGVGRHRWNKLSYESRFPGEPSHRQRELMSYVSIYETDCLVLAHHCRSRFEYENRLYFMDAWLKRLDYLTKEAGVWDWNWPQTPKVYISSPGYHAYIGSCPAPDKER